MKVYLIMCETDYEGEAVEAVYASAETARLCSEEMEKKKRYSFEHYSVQEMEVIE